MRVRFAPSPTGHLHVGNARTALFNWLLARRHGGTFILRVEDTDRERSTAAAEAAIKDDLQWLGLVWDEGIDAGGAAGPYRQSERLELYATHTAQLLREGHAYRCFCAPERLEADRQAALAASLPPKYPGTCRALTAAEVERRLAAGERAAVRLRVPANRVVTFADLVRGPVSFHTDVIGDPVIVRGDGIPAYNYAVVIDDALMHITHVVRGEDHISNTPRQLLVYEAFGWTPPAFAHLSLVLGPDHAPLSKRHGATSVAEFRAKGYLPEALANYLALIGWSPGEGDEVLPLATLASRFDLDAVGHSAGVFDEAKLAWVNRHYLKGAPPERLAELARRFLERVGWLHGAPSPALTAWLRMVVPPVAASIDKMSDVSERLAQVFAYDAVAALGRDEVRAEATQSGAVAVARAWALAVAAAPRLTDKAAFRDLAKRVGGEAGAKGKVLFHSIRLVSTGEPDGLELDVLVPAIDQAASLTTDDGLVPVLGIRERAAAFIAALDDVTPSP
ncbi:MAG: glutamate--tRNA ligase [Acidobacteriota bacterium]